MKLKQATIWIMLGLLLVVTAVALLPLPGRNMMGDVDADNRITFRDYFLIARVSSQLEPPNCASDYDRSGKTDVLDALKVYQIASGLREHNTGTCDNSSKRFVCGDANGDGRVTQIDANLVLSFSRSSGANCTVDGICELTGEKCIDYSADIPGVSVCNRDIELHVNYAIDSGSTFPVDSEGPDYHVDLGDYYRILYYLRGYADLLDGCASPYRAP